ncbi:MAG: riboflavin synthase [Deltaproteobacteria bacterium]|nr:riboflavin synthase [Deltaproteobacteria bacterium]
MFTGLIQNLGNLKSYQSDDGQARAEISILGKHPPFKKGDSIAVNGVCLTAITAEASTFTAQISPETLSRTNLSKLSAGDKINLEFPVQAQSFLGGHIVQGHVDAIAKITNLKKIGDYWRVRVQYPTPLANYFIEKGSVTIDGVSLTINQLLDETNEIELMIIPHTWNETIFHTYVIGQQVNLEVDVIAKYVARQSK